LWKLKYVKKLPSLQSSEDQLQSIGQHFNIVIPEIRKITLALDGSESSLQACEAAAIVAKGLKAMVTAVYVLPPRISIRSAPVPDEHARASIERAMSMLTSYEGVSSTSEILDARSLSVSESLIDYITKEKSDLAICGTRGLGGFERMLLGSVSSNLASYSPCPVMVVRRPEGKKEFRRILVATDGSESASRGVGLAIRLAKALSLRLTFVYVIYLPPVSYTLGEGSWLDQAMAEYREEAKKITVEAKSIAKENGVEADAKVVEELHSPVVAITKLAEEGGYDLITVGTRGLGGFKKLALGSVANGVVHYAHCSVLVAK